VIRYMISTKMINFQQISNLQMNSMNFVNEYTYEQTINLFKFISFFAS